MATTRVPVLGGPLDGVTRPAGEDGVARRTTFAWLDQAGRVHAGAAPGRELYVLERLGGGRGEAYVFAGDSHYRCDCGGYVRKAEGGQERQPCPLCGASNARRAHGPF